MLALVKSFDLTRLILSFPQGPALRRAMARNRRKVAADRCPSCGDLLRDLTEPRLSQGIGKHNADRKKNENGRYHPSRYLDRHDCGAWLLPCRRNVASESDRIGGSGATNS